MHQNKCESAQGTPAALNPVVFSLMDDGCPNCQGVEELSIWDIEPAVQSIVTRVCDALSVIGIGEASSPAASTPQ